VFVLNTNLVFENKTCVFNKTFAKIFSLYSWFALKNTLPLHTCTRFVS